MRAATNPAIALRLPSTHLVRQVVEAGSLVATFAMWRKSSSICIVIVFVLVIGAYVASVVERAQLEKRAPEGWRRIRAGMNAQEVEALFGAADSVSFFLPTAGVPTVPSPSEQWYYSFGDAETRSGEGRFVVSFTTGRVDRLRVR